MPGPAPNYDSLKAYMLNFTKEFNSALTRIQNKKDRENLEHQMREYYKGLKERTKGLNLTPAQQKDFNNSWRENFFGISIGNIENEINLLAGRLQKEVNEINNEKNYQSRKEKIEAFNKYWNLPGEGATNLKKLSEVRSILEVNVSFASKPTHPDFKYFQKTKEIFTQLDNAQRNSNNLMWQLHKNKELDVQNVMLTIQSEIKNFFDNANKDIKGLGKIPDDKATSDKFIKYEENVKSIKNKRIDKFNQKFLNKKYHKDPVVDQQIKHYIKLDLENLQNDFDQIIITTNNKKNKALKEEQLQSNVEGWGKIKNKFINPDEYSTDLFSVKSGIEVSDFKKQYPIGQLAKFKDAIPKEERDSLVENFINKPLNEVEKRLEELEKKIKDFQADIENEKDYQTREKKIDEFFRYFGSSGPRPFNKYKLVLETLSTYDDKDQKERINNLNNRLKNINQNKTEFAIKLSRFDRQFATKTRELFEKVNLFASEMPSEKDPPTKWPVYAKRLADLEKEILNELNANLKTDEMDSDIKAFVEKTSNSPQLLIREQLNDLKKNIKDNVDKAKIKIKQKEKDALNILADQAMQRVLAQTSNAGLDVDLKTNIDKVHKNKQLDTPEKIHETIPVIKQHIDSLKNKAKSTKKEAIRKQYELEAKNLEGTVNELQNIKISYPWNDIQQKAALASLKQPVDITLPKKLTATQKEFQNMLDIVLNDIYNNPKALQGDLFKLRLSLLKVLQEKTYSFGEHPVKREARLLLNYLDNTFPQDVKSYEVLSKAQNLHSDVNQKLTAMLNKDKSPSHSVPVSPILSATMDKPAVVLANQEPVKESKRSLDRSEDRKSDRDRPRSPSAR